MSYVHTCLICTSTHYKSFIMLSISITDKKAMNARKQ